MAVMNPYNYKKPNNYVVPNVEKSKKEENVSSDDSKSLGYDKSVQYLENRIMSAKPEELTFMLYEGLVKFIKKSIIFLGTKNFAEVNYNAQRAQAIIDELRSTLNMDIAISQSLDSLYEYMAYKLLMANVEKSEEGFEAALEIAESFKATWKEAFNIRY